MRWWIIREGNMMSVDNDSASDMNLSALPSNVYMVEWRDGKGEIEYVGSPQLRENFIDVMPYAPFFQQFLAKMVPIGLTLTQAKKMQNDLILMIYDSKRQLPYAYNVTAGNYTWDATDGSTAAMSLQIMPTIFAGIGAGAGGTDDTIDKINWLIDQINVRLSQIHTNDHTIVAQANGQLVAVSNALVTEINTDIMAPTNAYINKNNEILVDFKNKVNSQIVDGCTNVLRDPGDALVSFINNKMLGDFNVSENTINGMLQRGGSPLVAQPGLMGNIIHSTVDFGTLQQVALEGNPNSLAGITTGFGDLTDPIDITPIAHVDAPGAWSSTILWIPLGQPHSVALSINEMIGIMSGIAQRQQVLVSVRSSKLSEIAALGSIAAVIAYNVTTGWP